MSVDQACEFVKRYATDAEFRDRIDQAASQEERRAFMEEAGFSEVRLQHLANALPRSAGGELSEEGFAAVAGGDAAAAAVTVTAGSLVTAAAGYSILMAVAF